MVECSKRFRVLSIVLACLQNMTLGGIFYGWASISGGLLISSTHNGGPGLSPDYVHMIFVIASFCNFLGPLALGFILDSYGPRVCSIVSVLLITAGSAMFAMSDKDDLPLFIPGMCLIAFGGPGTQNAIIHLSNLFPEWKATATSFIVGSFQLSFIVFLIFDKLWSADHYSYTTLFMGYAVLCVANLVLSMLMWPDKAYSLEEEAPEVAAEEEELAHCKLPHEPAPLIHMARIRLPSVMIHRTNPLTPRRLHQEEEQRRRTRSGDEMQPGGSGSMDETLPVQNHLPMQIREDDHNHHNHHHHDHHHDHHHEHYHQHGVGEEEKEQLLVKPAALTGLGADTSATSTAAAPAVDLKDASFNEQILSAEFLWLTFFFLVNTFWANFYIGTFDMQLGDKHSLTPELRHEFAQWFTMSITMGVLTIPPIGALMDRKGFPATSLVCLLSGVAWALLLIADSPQRHYLMYSFVFYSIYRTSLFTFFFAYLADVLGFQFFGMMGGIIFLMAGVLGMLQYPLGMYAAGTCHVYSSDPSTCDKGRWGYVNAVMVVMLASTFLFTYQDFVRRRAQLRALEATESASSTTGKLQLEIPEVPRGAYGAV